MSERPIVRFLDKSTPPHILTLVLLSGIGAMNMSAFLPSLPAMAEYFDTDYSVMQLSVSGYLATTALIQLIAGPLSDKFGRRPITLWALIIFIIASIGCALATTIEAFLAFRMLQGAVATGLALSRAIVRDMVPQNEAASMIGYVTMGMALVPMIAPMVGGALDQILGWESVFWALTFAGLGVFALCWADQGETVKGSGISFSQQLRDYPELISARRFWGYVFCAAFASGTFFAFLGGAPFVASEVFGLSSFWAGVCFGAPPIGYALGNFITGRHVVRVGVNNLIVVGSVIGTFGLTLGALLTWAGLESAFLFFGFCTFIGFSNGLVMPNANAGLLSVRPHLAGTASGLGASIMIAGGAALSVFAGVALSWGGGSLPLLIIMAVTMALSLLSILYVVKREREVQDEN